MSFHTASFHTAFSLAILILMNAESIVLTARVVCREPSRIEDAPDGSGRRTDSNGYRGTGPGERVGSVNERSYYHRVVSRQLHNAQTSTSWPCTTL